MNLVKLTKIFLLPFQKLKNSASSKQTSISHLHNVEKASHPLPFYQTSVEKVRLQKTNESRSKLKEGGNECDFSGLSPTFLARKAYNYSKNSSKKFNLFISTTVFSVLDSPVFFYHRFKFLLLLTIFRKNKKSWNWRRQKYW